MDLRDYAAAVRRHWIFTIASAVLFSILAIAYHGLSTPTFQASATLFVSPGGASSNTDLGAGLSYAQSLVTNYVTIAESPLVLNQVIDQLELQTSAADLARSITVTNPPTSTLIQISVQNPDPEVAAAIANATGAGLQSAAAALSPKVAADASPLQVAMITPATAPTTPSGPGTAAYAALGALVGLVLAITIAVLVELFNVRIRNDEDARAVTAAPILGVIPESSVFSGRPLVVKDQPDGRIAEAFRALRTNVQFLDGEERPQVIAVTSALVREGKTITALNLALAIADTGHSVALIDGDLRASRLGRILAMSERAGLADLLLGEAELPDVLVSRKDLGVDVVPAGSLVGKPAELLQSRWMVELLERMRSHYSYVVIDTPALLPVSDGAVIARLADGALLVVSARGTRKAELRAGLAVLDRVRSGVLGLVMTNVPPRSDVRYTTRLPRRLRRKRRTAPPVADQP